MSLIGDAVRVAMSDLFYLKRNIWVLLATSLVTPLLYLVAFGYGLGQGVIMDGVPYLAFMIPGVVALTTLTSSFTSIANKIMIQRRFYESFDELRLCPISCASIILGKTVLGVVKGMLCGLLLLLLGHFLCAELQITAGLLLLMLLSCLVYALLGVTAGLLVRGLPTMNLFTSFVILPMTFLCGTMFSLDALPSAAQDIIWALPLTHTTECIRASALGWSFPWLSLLVLIVYAVVFYTISWYVLKNGKE